MVVDEMRRTVEEHWGREDPVGDRETVTNSSTVIMTGNTLAFPALPFLFRFPFVFFSLGFTPAFFATLSVAAGVTFSASITASPSPVPPVPTTSFVGSSTGTSPGVDEVPVDGVLFSSPGVLGPPGVGGAPAGGPPGVGGGPAGGPSPRGETRTPRGETKSPPGIEFFFLILILCLVGPRIFSFSSLITSCATGRSPDSEALARACSSNTKEPESLFFFPLITPLTCELSTDWNDRMLSFFRWATAPPDFAAGFFILPEAPSGLPLLMAYDFLLAFFCFSSSILFASSSAAVAAFSISISSAAATSTWSLRL
mmetsp:Transcript_691/g.2453  ORF Transcript_691/g.2453 Transcript_691/m.2453 type:complete len:312 (+) Transcript_691:137-1072(+)